MPLSFGVLDNLSSLIARSLENFGTRAAPAPMSSDWGTLPAGYQFGEDPLSTFYRGRMQSGQPRNFLSYLEDALRQARAAASKPTPSGTPRAYDSSAGNGSPGAASYLRAHARRAAEQYGLDPDIFDRQLQQESGYRVGAVSPAGARGPAQFMPDTGNYVARKLGVSPEEFWARPDLQVLGAALYMRELLDRYGGDYARALAAYNAGPGAVDRYGGVPPIVETLRYLDAILGPGWAGE